MVATAKVSHDPHSGAAQCMAGCRYTSLYVGVDEQTGSSYQANRGVRCVWRAGGLQAERILVELANVVVMD